jgi:hypothetical protein
MVFIMAQYIYISIARADPEIEGGWAVPLVLDFLDFQDIPTHDKADRALISLISGIAFDFYFTHEIIKLKRRLAKMAPIFTIREKGSS